MKANVVSLDKRRKKDYSDWLNKFKWTHFITLTTPYALSLNSARRLSERFYSKLKDHQYEPQLFWVAEKYESKDGYHLHGLLKINKKTLPIHEYKFITNLYQICAGTSKCVKVDGELKYINWSRIELAKYDKKRNGGGYCAKYVMAENNSTNAEYDFLV